MSDAPLFSQRVERCDAVLRHYGDADVFTSLVDLLADAMHWCDATANDFHYAFTLAATHYVAELIDKQPDERRMP